jgi:hypothetical protein
MKRGPLDGPVVHVGSGSTSILDDSIYRCALGAAPPARVLSCVNSRFTRDLLERMVMMPSPARGSKSFLILEICQEYSGGARFLALWAARAH